MYAFGETYLSAMLIPIPIRKWLIKRWNKQKEKERSDSTSDDTSQPLTPEERRRMIRQAEQSQPAPPRPPAEFLTARRNTEDS